VPVPGVLQHRRGPLYLQAFYACPMSVAERFTTDLQGLGADNKPVPEHRSRRAEAFGSIDTFSHSTCRCCVGSRPRTDLATIRPSPIKRPT
jgi:hypothetical protein